MEHDWDGCKCRRCGETRDEGHDWVDTAETEYVATSFESGNSYGDYFPVRICARCGARYDWQKDVWGY